MMRFVLWAVCYGSASFRQDVLKITHFPDLKDRERWHCWEVGISLGDDIFAETKIFFSPLVRSGNIWVPPALIRPWISSVFSFQELSPAVLSSIFQLSPFSLLTCSSPFSVPAVYSNRYVDPGQYGHPWWEKQCSHQRCSAHAHGYAGPGHWSGNGAEYRLCHKPLQGPAPPDLHSNCWLGNSCLHVSDMFCSDTAQLARGEDKHKIKCDT